MNEDDALDALAQAMTTLPEPLAAAAAAVELARADGDATGVRKRALELGVGVVRYGVSIGLSLLLAELGEQRAPKPLQRTLGGAARLSDGQWCELLRGVAAQLGEARRWFRFANGKPLAELVRARNRFAHEGTRGDEAAACARSVLEDARELLAIPLRLAVDEHRFEERRGVPLRAGAWRKREGEVPIAPGMPYLLLEERALLLSPWLPELEGRLLLMDTPAAAGKPWRSLDPESGERREARELGAAIRKLVGDDASLPIAPSERPTLVGRGSIVSAMRRVAERAREGGVYLFVLTGPQGIGRGRLLELMRDAAAQFGFGAVLESSCSPMRRSVLRPLRRALADHHRLRDVAQAAERAASGDSLAGEQGLAAAIEAVEETLVEASGREPLLWILDDAQWADDATLSLMSLLAERAARLAEGHMLVLAGIRDEPGASLALRRFVGEVEREVGPAATRLSLGPLEERDARRLVTSTAPLDRRLEDALVAGAAGVPFYLVQSALAWFETGGLVWKDGLWHPADPTLLEQPVPGMADVVRARLAACFSSEDELRNAEKILFLVGTAQGSITLALLSRAARGDVDVASSERVLEALVDAGIVECRGAHHEYSFAQPMVRRAVVSDLEKRPWGPRLHRAFLDAVAEGNQADEDALFLAEGYRALGIDDAARRWLERAVDYALGRGLFREADERARELEAHAADAIERARAVLLGVEALLRSGDAARAAERLHALETPADARLALRARILRTALGDAANDDALPADADGVDRRLGLEARLALARRRRGRAGLALAEHAVTLLAPDDPPELRYRVLVTRSELLSEMRSLDDPACRAAIEETVRAARAVGSTWALLDAENDWALLEAAAGHVDEAIGKLERVASEAAQHHFGSMKRGALVNIGALHLRAERAAAAEQSANRAQELSRATGDARHLYLAQSVRCEALRRLRRLDEALAAADDAVRAGLVVDPAGAVVPLLRRSDIRAATGDDAGALEDARRAEQEAQNDAMRTRARLCVLLLRCARHETGARDELQRLVDQLGRQTSPPLEILLARARALLTPG